MAVGPREASVITADLPVSVLHYVVRTKESALPHDESGENHFFADAYIRWKLARSVLCLPLLKETTLVGVLYLENNLAVNVFTAVRIVVLKNIYGKTAAACRW